MAKKPYEAPVIGDRCLQVGGVIKLIDLVSKWREEAAEDEDANAYTLRCCADELENVLLECIPSTIAGL